MTSNALLPLIFAISLLRGTPAWVDREDWIELGNGECRHKHCQEGCSHPWTTRSNCTCSLDQCLDYAVYNAEYPLLTGFRRLPAGQTFNWRSSLTVNQHSYDSRGARRQRWSFSVGEAATICHADARCKGFECSEWSGRCTAFFKADPESCVFHRYYTYDPDTVQLYCYDGDVSYVKDHSVIAPTPPDVAAVHYGPDASCTSYCVGGSSGYGSFYYKSKRCLVYDQPGSGSASPAFGVDGSSGSSGTCMRSTQLSSAAADDSDVAISMTDSNGQELKALEVDTKVALTGPFAVVQTGFKFKNEQPRTIEGRFRYVLPPSAAVQRLAMKINGYWMEGEVVETKKARKIWTELLLQRRDPALLEQEQGNVYSVKIFPISGGAEVELILTYSVLALMRDGERRLRVPMRGLPPVLILRTLVVVGLEDSENVTSAIGPQGELAPASNPAGLAAFEQVAEGVPVNDIIVKVAGSQNSGHKSNSLNVAGYTVTWHQLGDLAPPSPRPGGGNWRFYIDTSASTADTFVSRLTMIEEFFNLLADKVSVDSCSVFAFDMDVATLVDTTNSCSNLGSSVKDAMAARLPMGMTHMEKVLAHASVLHNGVDADYVVLITDAIATLGARSGALESSLNGFSGKLYVLNIGVKIDIEVATEVAGLGGGRVVSMPVTGNSSVAALRMSKAWDDLLAPVGTTGVLNATSNATKFYPARFYDLKPGSEVVYFSWGDPASQYPPAPDMHIGSTVIQAPSALSAAAGFNPLLEREAVRAELAWLERKRSLAQTTTEKTSIYNRMVTLSTTKRVVCPVTALLVLETEQDYVRFGIDRNALKDILVVTTSGVVLQSPAAPNFRPGALEAQEDSDEPEMSAEEQQRLDSGPAGEALASGSTRQATANIAIVFLGLAALHWGVLADLGVFAVVCGIVAFAIRALGCMLRCLYAGNVFLVCFNCACRLRHASLFSRVGQQMLALLVLLSIGSTLYGCENYDECFGCGPTWLDVQAWGQNYLAQHPDPPTNRDRKAAVLYAEALAATAQVQKLSEFSREWLLWDPTNPQVYEQIGTSALASGDTATAVRAFTSSAEVASSNPEQLLRAAWLCISASEFQLAVTLAKRSIEGRDENPNAHRALGIAKFLLGDLSGARTAYAAARWRCDVAKCQGRWRYYWDLCDQSMTPHVLATELSYMEYHSQSRQSYRLTDSDAQCAAPCNIEISTEGTCAEAAGALNIASNGRSQGTMCEAPVCQGDCDTEERGSFTMLTPSCFLGPDGVELAIPPSPASRGSEQRWTRICKCPSPAEVPTLPRFTVVMSWLGDGNNVDLHMKSRQSQWSSSSDYKNVREGLGPEMLSSDGADGDYKIGVYYSWAAAMGSARGVVVMWDTSSSNPTVLPFALPPGETYIIDMARVMVTESVNISGGLLLR